MNALILVKKYQVWTWFVENYQRYSSTKSPNFKDICMVGGNFVPPPPHPIQNNYKILALILLSNIFAHFSCITYKIGMFPNFKVPFSRSANGYSLNGLSKSKLEKNYGRIYYTVDKLSWFTSFSSLLPPFHGGLLHW